MDEMTTQNPSVSSEDILNFENRAKVTLPSDYREFLLNYNGGVPHKLYFTVSDYGDSILDELFGLEIGGVNDLYIQFTDYNGRIPEAFLPIGRDQVGNLILLGLEGKYKGRIYFWWHENESEGKKPWLKNIYSICDSFNKFLSDLVLNPYISSNDTLQELFGGQDYEKQLELINSRWDVNTPLERTGTAIQRVSLNGSTKVLKALIEKGAKLDGALEMTLTYDNVDAAKILLDAGADPNLKTDNEQSTILLDATRGSHKEIAKLLIEYGANVRIGNGYHTPLSSAELKVKRGNIEMQEIVDLIKSKLQS